MRITNTTHWRTDQIRRLIKRVAQDELDKGQLKHLRVVVRYRRSNSCVAGRGHVGLSGLKPDLRMYLHLLRESVNPVGLAHTIAHEFGHNKGLRHRDMHGPRYMYADGWRERYAYANGFPIERKPEPPALTREQKLAERRAARVLKAQRMLLKWERASKRANTHVKKWRSRLKAAERLAASGIYTRPSSEEQPVGIYTATEPA